MANAFFSAETGAGLFFVSLLLNFKLGMLAGLAFSVIFKTYFHLAHMGVPAKSWRAILRPDRSWISRGLLGIVFYVGFGALHLFNQWGAEPILPEALGTMLSVLAGAAALVVMTYQGFAMSHSSAIALWSTGIMPAASFVYAVTVGLFLALAIGWNGFFAADPQLRATLVKVALGALAVVAAVLLSWLHGAHHGSPGGHKSVQLLTKELYSKPFYGLIWLAGLVLPALLLLLGGNTQSVIVLAAVGVLAGFYTFRVLVFKAGVFEPIMSFRP